MTPAVERVVVYRLGSLGDTVVALPCLHAVADAFPEAERIMLTNIPVSAKAAPLEAILGGSGLVDRFIAYPVGTRSLKELVDLRRSLRALDARTLVYLTPARGLRAAWRDLLYFRWCGFRRIIGLPLTKDLQENRRGGDGLIERECERLGRCAAPRGAISLDEPHAWDRGLSRAERDAGRALLGRVADQPRIAINMGGKVVENDWGEANWSALIVALVGSLGVAHPDVALVFVGSVEDAERAERVGALWPGAVANLCGKGSPRISAAAMSGARVFVGHDSGPLHLAACAGVACVGLFGNHDEPRKYHPYGLRHRVVQDLRGVSYIRVEQVEEAVLGQLAAGNPQRTTARAAIAQAVS